MDSKKLARVLQTAAKKFNYDIKLTHAQEIIAIMSGFENRHALFKSEEKNVVAKKPEIKIEMGDQYHGEEFNLFDAMKPLLQNGKLTEFSVEDMPGLKMYDFERYFSILIPNSCGKGFVLGKSVGQTNQPVYKPSTDGFIYDAVNQGFRGFNESEKDCSMQEFQEKYKNSVLEITKEEYEFLQTVGSNCIMQDYVEMMLK